MEIHFKYHIKSSITNSENLSMHVRQPFFSKQGYICNSLSATQKRVPGVPKKCNFVNVCTLLLPKLFLVMVILCFIFIPNVSLISLALVLANKALGQTETHFANIDYM